MTRKQYKLSHTVETRALRNKINRAKNSQLRHRKCWLEWDIKINKWEKDIETKLRSRR